MTLYLDSSTLVKLYMTEEGTDEAHARVASADLVTTSILSYVEVRAAFARRRREGLISEAECARATRQFERDWTTFMVVPLGESVMRGAASLTDSHALRGGDAVQLASFECLIPEADDDGIEFLCADDRLSDAARNLG